MVHAARFYFILFLSIVSFFFLRNHFLKKQYMVIDYALFSSRQSSLMMFLFFVSTCWLHTNHVGGVLKFIIFCIYWGVLDLEILRVIGLLRAAR